MFYALMVTAATSVAVITAFCFWMRWNKWYIVAGLQFVVGTAVTFGVSAYATKSGYQLDMFWASAGLCALLALLFAGMTLLFGPLDSPEPGAADKKYQDQKHRQEDRAIRKRQAPRSFNS